MHKGQYVHFGTWGAHPSSYNDRVVISQAQLRLPQGKRIWNLQARHSAEIRSPETAE